MTKNIEIKLWKTRYAFIRILRRAPRRCPQIEHVSPDKQSEPDRRRKTVGFSSVKKRTQLNNGVSPSGDADES